MLSHYWPKGTLHVSVLNRPNDPRSIPQKVRVTYSPSRRSWTQMEHEKVRSEEDLCRVGVGLRRKRVFPTVLALINTSAVRYRVSGLSDGRVIITRGVQKAFSLFSRCITVPSSI
ncbi:uncharacterized protein MYCFIDRAFT_171984 [Pseudocercospora fijiensis CIRAD86]|uniref:Uncharacterized protein n=1 Tax=Pseudocercospora fijiensis (strain CIRAD86) TaxID=383855 RepID=M3ANM3_PSEFD|nr:uncharacterized protein MYCFIDRAFT_171984 [Pseudocercospora fijiensis CIRAD86]EME86191.1 hypothetical protein MYCFIDRAFT_171984 [Pseudocercospora fijiensis CIRAD86]